VQGRSTERLPATFKRLGLGLHSDGGNLYLQVSDGTNFQRRRSWIFRYTLSGRKRRDMGLGSVNDVGLTEARNIAREYRKLMKQGIDPIKHRDTQRAQNLAASVAVVTFDQAAEAYIRQHGSEWKNADHAAQWRSSLKTYASPIIGQMSVADITTPHVMKVLDPIWQEKTETASRVRGRIEAVLGWASASGYRQGENPARWRDHLDNLLASRGKVHSVKHQPALPYAEMPAFIADLHKRKGMAALALEFAILTCVRSADVVNAKHADIDRAARIWIIPSFSKTGVEHRVPLSTSAVEVFDRARKIADEIGGEVGRSEFAFPNDVTGEHISSNALLGVIERMGRKGAATTHGFRASFRTWAQEQTNFPWELSEMSLGHKVGSKVERAYARGDAFKKRVAIMQAWADYCARPQLPGKVIPLQAARV
jgi:integrase